MLVCPRCGWQWRLTCSKEVIITNAVSQKTQLQKFVRLAFKYVPVLVAALFELEHVDVEGGVEGDVGHELHGLLLGGVAPRQAAVAAPPALITVPYQEEARREWGI